MLLQILIVVRSLAGDDHHPGTFFLQYRLNGDRGTAAAQNQNLFSGNRQTGFFQHGGKSGIIRVMPNQLPFKIPDKRVHSTQPLGGGGELFAVGDDGFLVGNGHIDSGEIRVFQKILQLLRLFFKQGIGVIPQKTMNPGGVAVPQLFTQQTANHHTTSE